MIDTTLTEEAVKIVTGARNKAYDAPERNFHRIALAWEALTDRAYTPAEVALMMVALKLVRESHMHQRDNIVDGIGYLLTAEEVTPKQGTIPTPAPVETPRVNKRGEPYGSVMAGLPGYTLKGNGDPFSFRDWVPPPTGSSFPTHPAAESWLPNKVEAPFAPFIAHHHDACR